MLINPLVLLVIVIVALLVGWFARKQLVKIRPDEVARADVYGNTAVDNTSAFVKSAEARARAAVDETKTKL